MTPHDFLYRVVRPGLGLLPSDMDSLPARCQLVATGGQEGLWQYRRQLNDGPAHGYYQCESGPQSGLAGVLSLSSTQPHLQAACTALDIQCALEAIYEAMVFNDPLATVVARLILWADPTPLPPLGAIDLAWDTYKRCWGPGKPDPGRWPDNYWAAMEVVAGPWPLVS